MNRRDLKAVRTVEMDYACPDILHVQIDGVGLRIAYEDGDEAIIQAAIDYVNQALNSYATQIEGNTNGK
jgi:hypothetical protein